MIDAIEEVVHAQPLIQSPAATHNSAKPQATAADTVQISDTAKAALEETMDTRGEVVINAKCGDLEAQRLIEKKAVKRRLLGLEQAGD